MAKISVPAEELIPGPIGYRVQVVDYDSTTRRFNGAHDLPPAYAAEPAGWQRGDPTIVGNRRFHAQNVYALVMKTLARFEFALGRRVGWSFKTHQLKVAPNGMLDANAFYSPRRGGARLRLFPGRSGATVYTCLSHDIVVHETTHALLDALRERYLDPSSPDQAAFHEGFADVIALLSVFSQPELIRTMLLAGARTSAPRALIDQERRDRGGAPARARCSAWPSRWARRSRACAAGRSGTARARRPIRRTSPSRSSTSRTGAARSWWPR